MLNNVETSTQPCLTTFVHLQAYHRGTVPPLLGTWQETQILPYFSKVDKGHEEVHILILEFLLKLSCCEDNANCSSVLSESTLAFC